MIYVDPFLPASQYIVRCYNGLTNSSAGNCGFRVSREEPGHYFIDFGFYVNDRFVSLSSTLSRNSGSVNPVGNGAVIYFHDAVKDVLADTAFYLIVY